MTRYKYATLPLAEVVSLTGPAVHPDGYLSDDEPKRRLESLLSDGFRWVRTDGDTAVFERVVTIYPAMEKR